MFNQYEAYISPNCEQVRRLIEEQTRHNGVPTRRLHSIIQPATGNGVYLVVFEYIPPPEPVFRRVWRFQWPFRWPFFRQSKPI